MYPWSRYRYCTQYQDDDEKYYLDEREPFRFREEADNRIHKAKAGDTWWGLAHIYFDGIPRKCGLWWLLCEYQPTPIIDPTIAIKEGELIIIPSLRVLRMLVFNQERRRYH